MTNNREQYTLISHFRSDFPSGIQIVTKFVVRLKNLACNIKQVFWYLAMSKNT